MLDVKILGDLEMDDVNTKLCVDEFYPKENLDITEIKQQENKILIRMKMCIRDSFCSQYEFEEWYDQLGGSDSPLADAILDRIAYDSYRINIRGIDIEHDISMREVYGLDKSLRE